MKSYLLLGDNETALTRQVVRLLMTGEGLNVEMPESLDTLLACLENVEPAFIMTYTGTEAIRASGYEGPLVVLGPENALPRAETDAFDHGADGYVPQPFHPAVLAARIRALMRRRYGVLWSTELKVGSISLDAVQMTAHVNGNRPIRLTPTETGILRLLMIGNGRVVPRGTLSQGMLHGYADDNGVDVYVARLRKKLGTNAIRTVRGAGYSVKG